MLSKIRDSFAVEMSISVSNSTFTIEYNRKSLELKHKLINTVVNSAI